MTEAELETAARDYIWLAGQQPSEVGRIVFIPHAI
jgi:hypothetical protein